MRSPRNRRALVRIETFRRARRTDFAEQKIAALLAMPARLGADAAVIHVFAVALALVGAGLAGDHARVKQGVYNVVRRFGLPREQASGGLANVGAVEVAADAAAQLL